jgi:hypothetical protein
MSTGLFDTERAENAAPGHNVFQLRKRTAVELNNVVGLTNIVALGNIIELNSTVELSCDDELINVIELACADHSQTAPACMNGVCSINWKPKRPTAA